MRRVFAGRCRRRQVSPPAHEPAAKAAPAHQSVLIKDVPFIVQEPDFCGEACAAMYLAKARPPGRSGLRLQPVGPGSAGRPGMLYQGTGRRADEDRLPHRPGVVPRFRPARQPGRRDAMAGDPRRPAGGHSHDRLHALQRPAATPPSISASCSATTPPTDAVIYHEPAQADGAYRRMARATFLKLWPLASGNGAGRRRSGCGWSPAACCRRRRHADVVHAPPITPST